MSKPKLLWHSNAPFVATGYGNQTGLFTPRLLDAYDLRVSAFYGLEGAALTYQGVRVLPGVGGTYGNEALPQHVRRFFDGDPRGGLVVTLMDVWVLDSEMCSQLDMACWVPVDHQPTPPGVTGFFKRSQAVPLAMSRFGMEQLAEFDPIYVPHGVDTSVYRPVDRADARTQLGIDQDAFMVGMVAANKGFPCRKGFTEALQAFARLREQHENAMLYLHTDIAGEWSQGLAFAPLIEALGIPVEAVGHADPYVVHFHPMAPSAMAVVYSAMDVLLNAATGEGFGIPVIEAQACGIPAIVTDFSAMREVCGAGWRVEGTRTWTGQRSWQMTPAVDGIVEALEACYSMPSKQRERMSQNARQHALGYDVDRVLTDFMLPGLAQARERLDDRKPTVIRPRIAA